MAWLEGHLTRILWSSDDSGFAIVKIDTGEQSITAVGSLAVLGGGEEPPFLALEGTWEEHQVHGRQFRVTGYLQGVPRTLQGMRLYLGSRGIPGVGPTLASRIVAAFGLQTLRVLDETPERLTEIEGIGDSRAAAVAERWAADENDRALTVTLRSLGLTERQVDRVRRTYGDRAGHVVRREPYQLAEDIRGIGFRTADRLALQLGVPPDSEGRIRAAAHHCLDQAAGDGHCYLPRSQLSRRVEELGVPTDHLHEAVAALQERERVVVEPEEVYDQDRIWMRHLFSAEVAVAAELGDGVADAALPAEVDRAADQVGVELAPEQRLAVLEALRGGVVVVTGGPGTGKTTLVRVLVRAVANRGEEWALASPTGRAARRLEDATGVSASTLHRLLEFRPGDAGFARGRSRPLEIEGLVIDEASMVDIELMAHVVRALPPAGARATPLVLVGDADQLPSVGPGRVLRDIIESGAVRTVTLQRIFRQGETSGIITAAAGLLRGDVPKSGEQVGADDFFLLPRTNPDRARQTLLEVVAGRMAPRGFDPVNDVQVLAPTRRGPLGTEVLNTELQARLNPGDGGLERRGRSYRVGDRVLCTRNRYDVDVFNGDVGRVVDAGKGELEIDFDGRLTAWSGEDLGFLDLAYAMTIHKSQGSEYPAVVLALDSSHGIMLRRNLFYTAVTRARRFFCGIGHPGAWERAAGQTGGDERYTALSERLARATV